MSRKIPGEVRPFLKYLNNTGGNDPDRLYGGTTNVLVNGPLALIECSVSCQIDLLALLHKERLLKQPRAVKCPSCEEENLYEKHSIIMFGVGPECQPWQEKEPELIQELRDQETNESTFELGCGSCGAEWHDEEKFWEEYKEKYG